MDNCPPVVLDIWDKDTMIGDSDDFCGRAIIYLQDLDDNEISYNYMDETPPTPKWHPVKMGFGKDEPTKGQFLVSFTVSTDYEKEFPRKPNEIQIAPQSAEFNIEINVLGLRDL